jgi:transcriptional regulator with XRE-family HTH domain
MIAAQCKMARAALGLGVRELASLAKVSPDTIARLERGEELRERTVDAIRAALEAAGVEFIAENGGGPGVRLRKSASGAGSIAAEVTAIFDKLARPDDGALIAEVESLGLPPAERERALRALKLMQPADRPAEIAKLRAAAVATTHDLMKAADLNSRNDE